MVLQEFVPKYQEVCYGDKIHISRRSNFMSCTDQKLSTLQEKMDSLFHGLVNLVF